MKNTMTAELLRTISVPTLVIAGEADHYMPPPLMRMIAAEIKGAETAVIPEVAHASFWERPEEFNRLVLGFKSLCLRPRAKVAESHREHLAPPLLGLAALSHVAR